MARTRSPRSASTTRAGSARRARGRPDPTLSFAALVAARAEAPGLRKGVRTRLRLKAATVRLLERSAYRELRVTDINEAAEVSNALFYVYFANKDVITLDVMRDFLTHLGTFPRRDAAHPSPQDAILRANLHYTRMFQANPGLMRCVFQLVDEFPAFAAQWHAWNRAWRDRVLRSLARAPGVAIEDPVERRFAVVALGTMIDGVLRRVYVERDPNVAHAALGADPERLARYLTRLWLRALFLGETARGGGR